MADGARTVDAGGRRHRLPGTRIDEMVLARGIDALVVAPGANGAVGDGELFDQLVFETRMADTTDHGRSLAF